MVAIALVAAAAVAGVLLLLTTEPPAKSPPGFKAHVVEHLSKQRWQIEPDSHATSAERETARALADRFAPTDATPQRRVVAVSLARVVGPVETYERVWVVYSENVLQHCLGTEACTEYARELIFLSPETLTEIGSAVF